MLRFMLFSMLLVGGLSLSAQDAAPVKKSCNPSQCQARKSAATTTTSAATTTVAVAQTTTAPERAAEPATAVVPTCLKKTSSLPTNLQLASLLEEKEADPDCDPKNCIPANCDPSACDPSTKMTTTLAAKQE
ncbi:MAG: hypothetical protein AAGJ93_12215 [Bacteroidota bacterium]